MGRFLMRLLGYHLCTDLDIFGLFECIQKAELLRGVLLFGSYRRCVDQRRDVQCFREMQNVSRPTKG